MTDLSPGIIGSLGLIAIWDAVWKAIGMWTAAQKKQKGWFIALFVLNTAGILPIIYLLINRQKNQTTAPAPNPPAPAQPQN